MSIVPHKAYNELFVQSLNWFVRKSYFTGKWNINNAKHARWGLKKLLELLRRFWLLWSRNSKRFRLCLICNLNMQPAWFIVFPLSKFLCTLVFLKANINNEAIVKSECLPCHSRDLEIFNGQPSAAFDETFPRNGSEIGLWKNRNSGFKAESSFNFKRF